MHVQLSVQVSGDVDGDMRGLTAVASLNMAGGRLCLRKDQAPAPRRSANTKNDAKCSEVMTALNPTWRPDGACSESSLIRLLS